MTGQKEKRMRRRRGREAVKALTARSLAVLDERRRRRRGGNNTCFYPSREQTK